MVNEVEIEIEVETELKIDKTRVFKEIWLKFRGFLREG